MKPLRSVRAPQPALHLLHAGGWKNGWCREQRSGHRELREAALLKKGLLTANDLDRSTQPSFNTFCCPQPSLCPTHVPGSSRVHWRCCILRGPMGAPVGCLFPKGSPGEPTPFCTSLHLETGRQARARRQILGPLVNIEFLLEIHTSTSRREIHCTALFLH